MVVCGEGVGGGGARRGSLTLSLPQAIIGFCKQHNPDETAH